MISDKELEKLSKGAATAQIMHNGKRYMSALIANREGGYATAKQAETDVVRFFKRENRFSDEAAKRAASKYLVVQRYPFVRSKSKEGPRWVIGTQKKWFVYQPYNKE